MAERGLSAVLLTRSHNVAWLTAGATTDVVQNSDTSTVAVAVTPERGVVLTTSIEAPRLQLEQRLNQLGLEIDARTWWEPESAQQDSVLGPDRRGSDDNRLGVDLSDDLQAMRTTLYPSEVERLRYAASCTAESIRAAVGRLQPGMSEFEIAAQMAAEAAAWGGQAVVNLVASDERISQFRHPLPSAKRVERYVMLVLCSRIDGLIAAATRLVHFGTPPNELVEKTRAVAGIDARLILSTRIGRTLGDQFSVAERAYAEAGYPEAIGEHHQGGSIGYLSREKLAVPGDPTPMLTRQAFAWNPSLRGTKSEDTVLLTEAGPEILTSWPEWPVFDIEVDGEKISRPAILEL
jgi:antitoxin VapB